MASERVINEIIKIIKIVSARGEPITKGSIKNFIASNEDQYGSHSDRDICLAIDKYRKYRDDNFVPMDAIPEDVKTAADDMLRLLCGLVNAKREQEVAAAEQKHQKSNDELTRELQEEKSTNEDLQAQLLSKTNKNAELEEEHGKLLKQFDELQDKFKDLELAHAELKGKYDERINAMTQMEKTIANLTKALEMNGISLSSKSDNADGAEEKED